ncbi:LysE family translocator [Pseudoalteromonas sp. T1lg65]|uniref:LysE family translocator n=1 Tax=Pseudoalteromonas sp. T1lg65 TaxID=2077101 RepID=UPI003F7B171C
MSVIIAMSLFALSMSISPGPVNLITLTTGLNFGTRRAMPFVSGATIGFTLLLYLLGLSYYLLVEQFSTLIVILGALGNGFIFYMGVKFIRSKPQLTIEERELPSFIQGVLLQWLNPKAWIACVAGITAFSLSQSHQQLLLFVMIYFVICYSSITAWALFGDKASVLVKSPQHVKVFNQVMGFSLMVIAIYLATELFLLSFG